MLVNSFQREAKICRTLEPNPMSVIHKKQVINQVDSLVATYPKKDLNSTNVQNSRIIVNIDRNMGNANHSNENLDTIYKMVNLDRLSLKKQINHTENKERKKLDMKETKCYKYDKGEMETFGKGTFMSMRVGVDVNGDSRRATNLKFKYTRDARSWTEAFGKTMGIRLRGLTLLGLLLTMLMTCTAAPARFRTTRSTQEKSAKSYLQMFGYLKKERIEIGNLQQWDAEKSYEDDFRIGLKTLQEFAGIPVTGELDEATLELMKRRRCGRPDIEPDSHENVRRKKRFAIQGDKWKHTNLTWSLSSKHRPSGLDPYETRAVLSHALDVWQQASRLTFTELNSDDVDILVSFVKRHHDDAYPFDGRGSILAHAFFPGSGHGGDAHFDDDELWLLQSVNEDEDGTSLLAVAAHEFGHSLGLSHSSVVGALMYPYYQGIQPNFVLPEDDRNGIQQLYGPKEKRTWAKIPHYRPPDIPPPATTTTTTTTRRPYIHQHYTKPPTRRPSYSYPRYPNYPERPAYNPDHRHHNADDYPKRTHHPRPTETTPHPITHRPHYPRFKPEYPSYPRSNYPTDSGQDYPKKKPYYPAKTTAKPTPPPDKPDSCDTSYDAVSLIRNELFIFKNRYHWRIGANGRYSGYPIEISRMWTGLPKNLTHVDAVYERPDRNIAFFVGKELYLFDSRDLVRGYPKRLVDLGLPESLEKLDAAMVWGHNSKTYFYSGSIYWKFDEDEGKVEPDYPRDMSMWKGVGYNIDSAFQWRDGKTYFFKGKGFWKFNDLQMRVEHERQLPSASHWMGCPAERPGTRARYHSLPAPGSTLLSPSAASSVHNNIILFIISTFLVYRNYFRYI